MNDLIGRIDLAELRAENEQLRIALEWYGERAKSLAENDWHKNPAYAEAIFVELSLDGGRRAELANYGR